VNRQASLPSAAPIAHTAWPSTSAAKTMPPAMTGALAWAPSFTSQRFTSAAEALFFVVPVLALSWR
jgi:hypothetical protein